MRLLVSVRSVEEALVAASGGAHFIDLKEPRAGALGGLPVATIREIMAALQATGCTLPVSATIGDLPMDDVPAILRQVQAVGDCGVTYVKVGIENTPGSAAVLQALATCGRPIVPVFIADRGLDFDLVGMALGFPGVMADTADKLNGSLFDVLPQADIRRFVSRARAAGVMVGLAGALRQQHLDTLIEMAPDFAGFRSAVCAGDRGSVLDAGLLRALAQTLIPTRVKSREVSELVQAQRHQ
jgi:(5-formylfuran-3-yl)methyl phosphate synthase